MFNFDFDLFCDRFNMLIKGKSQLELSKAMNLSQPVISKLKKHSGQTPSADTIARIAHYFNVSADWLLGLTDIKSTDKTTKELCDTLGLSEEAIKTIQEKAEIKDALNYLFYQHETFKNEFVSNDFEISIIETLSQFIQLHRKHEKQDTFFKISESGELMKGKLKFDTESGELFSNDVLGIEFPQMVSLSPVYSLIGIQMQEKLNMIISQLQYYINSRDFPEYKDEV